MVGANSPTAITTTTGCMAVGSAGAGATPPAPMDRLAWDLFAPEQEEPVASAVEKQLYIWLALPRSTAKPSRSHPRRELEEDKETARKEREQS